MSQANRGDEHITGREPGRAGMQAGMSANQLLDDDHNRVLQLFNEYENVKSNASAAKKHRIARTICRELKIHSTIEAEIYYPRMRRKADVDDRVAEAEADHARIEEMIRDVESASTQDDAFDRQVASLERHVRDHISEERSNLFDVAEVMGINTPDIARQLLARKQELQQALH